MVKKLAGCREMGGSFFVMRRYKTHPIPSLRREGRRKRGYKIGAHRSVVIPDDDEFTFDVHSAYFLGRQE